MLSYNRWIHKLLVKTAFDCRWSFIILLFRSKSFKCNVINKSVLFYVYMCTVQCLHVWMRRAFYSTSSASSSSSLVPVSVFSFWQLDSLRHLQNTVQGNLAELQRHCAVRHGFSDKHPQWMISKTSWGARATFVGRCTSSSDLEISSRFQP